MDGLRGIALNIFSNQEGAIRTFVTRLKEAGESLTAKITNPFDQSLVPPGPLRIHGTVRNYKDEHMYAFTGKLGRYWPSARIVPDQERWSADLNVGQSAQRATITLASINEPLVDYVEFYRKNAAELKYPGMPLPNFTSYLDRIEVNLDHRQH